MWADRPAVSAVTTPTKPAPKQVQRPGLGAGGRPGQPYTAAVDWGDGSASPATVGAWDGPTCRPSTPTPPPAVRRPRHRDRPRRPRRGPPRPRPRAGGRPAASARPSGGRPDAPARSPGAGRDPPAVTGVLRRQHGLDARVPLLTGLHRPGSATLGYPVRPGRARCLSLLWATWTPSASSSARTSRHTGQPGRAGSTTRPTPPRRSPTTRPRTWPRGRWPPRSPPTGWSWTWTGRHRDGGANTVADLSGNALSGLWASGTSAFPSGDGSPAEDFKFHLNVMPGTSTQREVDNSDLSACGPTTAAAPTAGRRGPERRHGRG